MEVNYLLNFYFLNLKKYLINRKNSRLYVNYFIKNGLRVYLYPINLKTIMIVITLTTVDAIKLSKNLMMQIERN